MRPVAVLGGTFNPVHHGHLRVAMEAKQRLNLDSVRMIPLYAPAHRDPPSVAAEIRMRMLAVAIDDEPGLVADDREIRRQGCSYTVDTLKDLRAELPQTPLCLLMGADAFKYLHTWHKWEQLSELAHIVVLNRPGEELICASEVVETMGGFAKQHDAVNLGETPAGKWISLSIPMLEISSTQIRSYVTKRESIRYLVPDAVLEIIRQQQLYKKL